MTSSSFQPGCLFLCGAVLCGCASGLTPAPAAASPTPSSAGTQPTTASPPPQTGSSGRAAVTPTSSPPSPAVTPRTSAPPNPAASLQLTNPARSIGTEPTLEPGAEPPDPAREQGDDDELQSVQLQLDAPYKLGQRPRVKGRIQAAGNDEELAVWNLGGSADPEHVSNKARFHPGVRVVVDTKLLSGRLPKRAPRGRRSKVPSEHSVLAHARKWGYWNFRICLEEALRRQGRHQTDHGQTIIHAKINSAGKVTAARLKESELKDKQAQECLLEQTREYKPFSPAPGKTLTVELSIKLWPGDAPVPLLEQLESDKRQNEGEVDLQAVREAFAAQEHRLRKCYARGLRDDEQLWGRMQLELTLEPKRQRARRVRETESHFSDRRVAKCVWQIARRVKLPAPKDSPVIVIQGIRMGTPPEN